MKILIASDHGGFELKEKIKPFIEELGYDLEDMGAFEMNSSDDYPDFIKPLAQKISTNPEDYRGIILGGSGQGEMMCANRFKNVRAALFYGSHLAQSPIDVLGTTSDNPFEIVKLSRVHNNANVLSIAGRFVSFEEAKEAVSVFLRTPFSEDERHERRIKKLEL